MARMINKNGEEMEFKPFPSPFKTADGIEYAPVIRCRDCRFYLGAIMECRWFEGDAAPNGFCFWGERKE